MQYDTFTPTPRDHITAHTRVMRAALLQLITAKTREERMDAWMWIDNSERHIAHWQREIEKETYR